MNLPGENTITLSHKALAAIVQDHLNNDRIGGEVLRVTGVNRPSSFKDEIEFQITTDPLPVPGKVMQIDPELLRKYEAAEPVPVPPEPLPVAADDRPF